MTATYRSTRDIPLDELTPFPGNARRGDVEAIRASLRRNGQYRSLVVREIPNGPLVVLAGNHTLQALAAEEHVQARCEVVQCDDATARRINLADNKTAELGSYDDDALTQLLDALDGDFDGTGWAQEDLADLIGAVEELPPVLGDPDDVPDAPTIPVSAPGDVWLLGPHRLMCGDAADVAAHDRVLAGERPDVLLMDPPYGMRLDTDFSSIKGSLRSIGRTQGTQGNKYEPVIGDHEDYDPQQVIGLYEDVVEQFWWGADYYAERIPNRTAGSWLVWDKRKESQAEAIGSEFELCWSRVKHKRRMLRHEWFGFLSAESPMEARNRVHPTQKPVALYVDILNQWGVEGGLVLDAYAGSGTTVLACQQLGMRAAVIEMSEAYTDVICRRFQQATGVRPILEATGLPHDFT